jgi:hypothetical protein
MEQGGQELAPGEVPVGSKDDYYVIGRSQELSHDPQ